MGIASLMEFSEQEDSDGREESGYRRYGWRMLEQ
jgi:hypothetical protein